MSLHTTKITQTPGVEIEYLPNETNFTGNTVLVFGRQRRTDLINKLVSGQQVYHATELVDTLLNFITQPVVVLDNILTKHNMRRNGFALMEIVNTRSVFIGKSDVTGFPDNVMAHVSHVFIDNSYNRDERKFMYEHYLKVAIPSLDKLNRLLNSLEPYEYLVIAIKGSNDRVYVYDIERENKIQESSQTTNPEISVIEYNDVTSQELESSYVIPRNESFTLLEPPITTTATTSEVVTPAVSTPVPQSSNQQSWLSYLTSFIW